MALSDDQIVNIWGREPRYHAAPIGSTDIAFARAVESEVRKQDEALIEQMQDALQEALELLDLLSPLEGDTTRKVRKAITAARARLGEKT